MAGGELQRAEVGILKVLVAGGTGFIGSSIVVELLKDKRYDVTVLSRSADNVKKRFGNAPVNCVDGDVTHPETLKDIPAFEVIFQCVQFPNHPVQNPSKGWTYEKVDGQGTVNLVNAVKNKMRARIIYLSGAGTSAQGEKPWFKAKWRAETAIRESGLDHVILRPSWVYGPGDRSMNRFIKMAKSLPFMPVIGDGQSRVAPLLISDLAKVCVRAIESGKARNQTISFGGPEIMTMNDLEKRVCAFLGKNKPLFHQPLWLMKAAGSVAEKILPKPPISSEAIDFITMDAPVDGSEAERIFDLKFKTLEEGLAGYQK